MADMADDTEETLPYLPPTAPTIPEPSTDSAVPANDDVVDGVSLTMADRMATRHVPTASASAGYGLPVQPAEPVTTDEFVRPALESMGPSTTAMLIGRGLMVAAMLLIGIAAQRSTGPARSERGEAFWPVAISAGVFVAVGIGGLVFWSVTLADNARRLKARSTSPRRMGWSWMPVLAWAVLSSLTFLRVEADADFDPLPGLAGIVFAALLAIPYALLQGVFRGLSRRPPLLWINVFPLDLAAFGLVWWRLTSWPDPVTTGDADHVRTTAYVALAAAGVLAINAIVFVLLAQRASASVFERLGRLETRHRGEKAPGPEWFMTGRQLKQDGAGSLD